MDSMTIALLFFWAVFFFVLWKNGKKKQKQKYTTEISDTIEKLNYINKQIHACEELLQEIRLTDDHHHKNFTLNWTTETDLIKEADIWVDGSSKTTEQLKALAEGKREELITSLFREIEKLPKRSHNNVIITTLLQPIKQRGSGQ